jgi:hypothetical protein
MAIDATVSAELSGSDYGALRDWLSFHFPCNMALPWSAGLHKEPPAKSVELRPHSSVACIQIFTGINDQIGVSINTGSNSQRTSRLRGLVIFSVRNFLHIYHLP